MKLNKQSQVYTDMDNPGQCMLYGTGLITDENKNFPQVGITSNFYAGNTCNMHLRDLADAVAQSMKADDRMIPMRFDVSGVSDGIAMGTDGMHASLPSRDAIADVIELTMRGQKYDAMIGIPGCDKNMPGNIIAMGRLNVPALMVYGGTILPGEMDGNKIDIVSSFEARGKHLNDQLSEEKLLETYKKSCPGEGACGGMYTANTMASAIEALGMSLPYSSSSPATSNRKKQELSKAVSAIYHLMVQDIKPSDIMTKEAFENALRIVMVLGGSTNAALHLPAMAHSVGVELNLDDIQRMSDKTPFLADLKPSGQYVMADLDEVGGIPAVMKTMLQEGYLNGNCLTVTGNILAENLEDVKPLAEDNGIIHSFANPIKETGHINVLRGNLSPTGAVAKITGKEGTKFEGPAAVYESEQAAIEGFKNHEIEKGSVVVIRGIGPKGAPGMPEMLKITSEIMGRGISEDYALITDARFSGGSHGFIVGHVTPEAQVGGPIALVQDGDVITIDAENRSLEVAVNEADMEKRRQAWKEPPLKVSKGVLLKYARNVSQADKGCITDL